MDADPKIEIPFNVAWLRVRFVIHIVCTLLSAVVLTAAIQYFVTPAQHRLGVSIMMTLGLIVMPLMAWQNLERSWTFGKAMIYGLPALVMSREGVTDNVSLDTFGLIRWHNLAQIRATTYAPTSWCDLMPEPARSRVKVQRWGCLIFYLKDEKVFVARLPIVKQLLKWPERFESTIHIDERNLGVPAVEVLERLNDFWRREVEPQQG